MRRLWMLGLALIVIAGCKKNTPPTGAAPAGKTPAAGGAVAAAPPGGGGQPGSGGVIQSVRQAALRPVAQNDLQQLQVFIESASAETGKLPTKDALLAMLQREAPNIYKHITDGAIELTGATSRSAIWAYTATPQRGADYLVLTSNGIEQMNKQQLDKRLGR